MYVFRFDVVWDHWSYFSQGLWITLWVSFASIGLGLAIGLVVALCRISRNPFLSLPMMAYIELFRNTPTLVKLVWVFYMIPILLGVELGALTSCILAMGISAGAYLAEVFRAGIQDVRRGDIEAAYAVGMTPGQTMRRIILPQAVRKTLPPTVNTFIVFIKYSSLVSVLGVSDLMYRANVIATTTFRPLEIFTVLAIFYFVICFGLSRAVGVMESRMAVDK